MKSYLNDLWVLFGISFWNETEFMCRLPSQLSCPGVCWIPALLLPPLSLTSRIYQVWKWIIGEVQSPPSVLARDIIMVSTSANWVLLMYVFLSVLEGAASENHHSHHPEIAVAGPLCCPVCTKQDAALLVTGGGRRQHGIFQHFSHLWPPVLASSQRWDLACLWCGKLCWSMTGDLLTILELYTQEMHI